MEIKELYALYKIDYKVSTDTRSIGKNSLFFALKGDNFNGNLYAEDALLKGAAYAIVDEVEYCTNQNIILVDNVLKTLQQLAKFHRQQLNIPVIALTGSNGKTTTKELIHAVLNEKYICAATKGNLNNHIGVPLTLLSIKPEVQIAVIEMGANHAKEIEMLSDFILPDYGFITNFGRVHLEGFGSLEGVIKAKTELYTHLKNNDKKAFVNTNDPIQTEKTVGLHTITFGGEKAEYPINFVSADPFVKLKFRKTTIESKLIGKYNYSNIATAVAIGSYFKVNADDIKRGIENYIPSNNRSQIINKGTNRIILDAYNANPNSMEVALENLSQLTDNNKIAILGDMFEIGENSMLEHQNIADLINRLNISRAFLIGNSFDKVRIENKKITLFNSFENFKKEIENLEIKNTTILIKASRGMALERLLEFL
ncbi:MAG: UDP-N-acetylmuramoyl-tripeptide--D-alanyl-D-alanine ligase [Flavobacteriaceae bacterium]|nr:UDP-N-acetylmuramoyl-tripeptide--D-alanyl-D-alanine ligase [Flavobacteriaceae bacterium]